MFVDGDTEYHGEYMTEQICLPHDYHKKKDQGPKETSTVHSSYLFLPAILP